MGIVVVALLAMLFGDDGGYDPRSWAWIDVASLDLSLEIGTANTREPCW
jgi:hypothetical protein